VQHLARGDLCRNAGLDGALEDLPKPLDTPALANAGQRGMVGQRLMQLVTGEPADPPNSLALRASAAGRRRCQEETRRASGAPQPRDRYRVGLYPSCSNPTLCAQPVEIEHPIDADQNVILGKKRAQRSSDKQLWLAAVLLPQHLDAP